MKKWEYLIFIRFMDGVHIHYYINGEDVTGLTGLDSKNSLYDYTNKLGKDGWELVSATHVIGKWDDVRTHVFKRPI